MSTPTGILSHAGLLDQRRDLLGVALHQPERRIDGAAQPDQAGLAVLRLEPGRVELVVHRGGAEIPQDRIGACPRHQRPAAQLVALPFADLGRGDVADVVDVEDQQRAELGFLQRLADAAEPVAVQPPVIDPLLEVDRHGAERRQRATPIVARVDVLGADRRRVAGDVVHERLLRQSFATISVSRAPRSTSEAQWCAADPGSPQIQSKLDAELADGPGSAAVHHFAACTASGERSGTNAGIGTSPTSFGTL